MRNFSLLILCAGFGKRMLDLTANIPKPLLKINNHTLLSNSINFFTEIGCNEIFINTHYLHNKIETYINKAFNHYPINLIFEPSILGTGGGVKNIYNYTKNKNLCVVNSDILWNKNNRADILEFIEDIDDLTHCKLLLSKKENFYGLKKTKGDFNLKNNIISDWNSSDDILYYSGFQIVSKNIFEGTPDSFSMNEVWKRLIVDKKLKGSLTQSDILHVGDKNSFDKL